MPKIMKNIQLRSDDNI